MTGIKFSNINTLRNFRVGQYSAQVYYPPLNLDIWDIRPTGNTLHWENVCWSPELSKFVAVAQSGTGNRVMYSSDGINWTQPALSSAINSMGWMSVCWSKELGKFVAVAKNGTGNRVMYSSDGINWTQPSLSSAINGMVWNSICWSPELMIFVAVAESGTGSKVMYSGDGITWLRATSAYTNTTWRSVCWSPTLSMFVAVAVGGIGNRAMYSYDGITWVVSPTSRINGMNWYKVCWSSELSLFVAVARTSNTSSPRAIYSSDGINWSLATIPTESNNINWEAVCWSSELMKFVAVAFGGIGNKVMHSSDGINWEHSTLISDVNTKSWYGVCWSPELYIFVAVGSNGSVITSGTIVGSEPIPEPEPPAPEPEPPVPEPEPPVPELNTGAGPNTVLSSVVSNNKTIKYYGEVLASDFFTGNELSTLVGLSSTGILKSSDTKWFKFGIDDDILFVPANTIRSNITWNALYSNGLVYGVDGFGTHPSGTPTNQLKTVSKGGYTYKVRLMTGTNSNPHIGFSNGGNALGTDNSEWNELMYRLSANNPNGTAGNFATYNDFELGITKEHFTWCQEQYSNITTKRVVRGYLAVHDLYDDNISDNDRANSWRPILVLQK